MPRERKGPWRRGGSKGPWYTTVGKRVVRVADAAATYDQAYEEYKRIHDERKPKGPYTFDRLADEFLEFVKQRRAPATFQFYARYLNSFIGHVGTIRPSDLNGIVVDRWISEKHGANSASDQHNAARCVVAVCNWAVKNRLLPSSPLLGYEKPRPTSRESYVTQEQFDILLSRTKDQEFQDVLNVLWHTGMRPQELRSLESKYVDLERRKVIFSVENSKGKRKPRAVWLDDVSFEIIERLVAQYPEGPIFRNTNGKPWRKDAIGNRFTRLRDATGIDCFAYALRHGYATRRLQEGLDSVVVGHLMGHADVTQVARTYAHVHQNDEFMQRAANGGIDRSA